MLHQYGSALVKRAIDETQEVELPAWAWLIFVLNLIIFFPLVILLNYTFKQIYPVLAIVEDENPPAYEPVSLNDDGASLAEGPAVSGSKPVAGASNGSHAITSSFRNTHRLLMADGGFRAIFRGFFCLLAQGLLTNFLVGVFSAVLGGPFTPIATLLASLALVQYSAAWVHIVISTRSQLHFWQRLPPFKRTFEATWKAVAIYWFASELNRWVPYLVAALVGLKLPEIRLGQPLEVPQNDGAAWKASVIMIASALAAVFITIPAHVILVRVQASLLPEGEDPILSFDRSFEGKVEPAIVGGKGYVSVRDAWSTFSKAAWRRLIILYVKIFVACAAGGALIAAILIPEFFLLSAAARSKDGN